MLEEIRKKNIRYDIQPVECDAFSEYGKIHEGISFPEMEKFVRNTKMPEETGGEFYMACSEELMNMGKEAELIKDCIYGQSPCQIGYYNGRADRLNAVEYHKCSEILILYEDAVLILGKLSDIVNGKLHTAKMKYFYVKKGTCVELYATTLHWAPCAAGPEGIRQVVVQIEGTNTPLQHPVTDREGDNRYLLERNKWVLIHEEAKASMSPEAYVGIIGENPVINY